MRSHNLFHTGDEQFVHPGIGCLEIFVPYLVEPVELPLLLRELFEWSSTKMLKHLVGEICSAVQKIKAPDIKVEMRFYPVLLINTCYQTHKEHLCQPDDLFIQHNPTIYLRF